MGVNKGCNITVNFCTDVFRFLFNNKGTDYTHGRGHIYKLDDFDATYFPKDWYKTYDRLGDGCEIEFPVRMYSKLKWSPVFFTYDNTSGVSPKNTHFEEVCVIWICKKRCM